MDENGSRIKGIRCTKSTVVIIAFLGLSFVVLYIFHTSLAGVCGGNGLITDVQERILGVVDEAWGTREDRSREGKEVSLFLERLKKLEDRYENTTENALEPEDWVLLTRLKNNITKIWNRLQWSYKGYEDRTEEYLVWRPHRGPADGARKRRESEEEYRKVAATAECDSNLWCDTWYQDYETVSVQELLWKHQHPADCRNSRILLWRQMSTGIGAMIHTVGVGLTHALNTGRVLVLEDPMSYVDREHCGGLGAMGCFFLPVSNCTLANSVRPETGDGRDANRAHELDQEFHWANPDHVDKRVVAANNWDDHFWCHYGMCANRYGGKGLYWWRAQAAAYVARPRDALTRYVERQKKTVFRDHGGEVPHPIMSMHVRHGDKWIEAKLYDLSDYMGLARRIKAKHGVSRIFLSTEDPGVIEEAMRTYSSEFEIFYHDIPRLNTDPFSSQRMLGPTSESLISYTTYLIALECDVFIGQRESGFSRLIDEGRKVLGKASVPYYDVGPKEYEPKGWWREPDLDTDALARYLSVCKPDTEKQPKEYDANLVSWNNTPVPTKPWGHYL